MRKFHCIDSALEALGVTDETLTAAEKQSLDDLGYVVIEEVLSSEQIDTVRQDYDRLMYAKYGDWDVGMMRTQQGLRSDYWDHERGTRRLTNLYSEARSFEVLYLHPRLLAAMHHILRGEFRCESLNAREALPGQGAQGLHADKPKDSRTRADQYAGVNSAWLLDDFTPENGATRIVPGTHRRMETPQEVMADPTAAHPDEVIVPALAGSVIVFNNHLWHGGTANRTERPRRVIHSSYVERHRPQNPLQCEYIRKSVYERLSPAARYILDV